MQDKVSNDTGDTVGSFRIVLWDLPIRLFHWSLVLLFAMAWWTAELRMLDWHRLAGYGIFCLLVFRLVWGVCGSTTARFVSFLRGPGVVVRYISRIFRRDYNPCPGHNPLGGWSVVAMLLLLLLQTSLGLFAVDVDGMESGPFSYLVSFETGRMAASLHNLCFDVLLVVIALHLIAILCYRLFLRGRLLGAMVSGRRDWPQPLPALRFVSPLFAVWIFLAVVGLLWLLLEFYGRA